MVNQAAEDDNTNADNDLDEIGKLAVAQGQNFELRATSTPWDH